MLLEEHEDNTHRIGFKPVTQIMIQLQ